MDSVSRLAEQSGAAQHKWHCVSVQLCVRDSRDSKGESPVVRVASRQSGESECSGPWLEGKVWRERVITLSLREERGLGGKPPATLPVSHSLAHSLVFVGTDLFNGYGYFLVRLYSDTVQGYVIRIRSSVPN